MTRKRSVAHPEETSESRHRAARLGPLVTRWYLEHRRDLPWRRRSDAYSVWISEVMLQQTTAATVKSRYDLFLSRFPDLVSLAEAREDEVLGAVAGMGYYRRFRAMKKAAETLWNSGCRDLPTNSRELRSLPGIGEYTAGAVASIAFGEPVPAVDGNVIRIVSRLMALEEAVETSSAKRAIRTFVEAMIPEGSASEFTQGLFDIGATLCTPTNPQCDRCPLRSACEAFRLGTTEDFPRSAPRKKAEPRIVAVASLRTRATEAPGKLVLCRRPEDASLMPGFWELPEIWLHADDDPAAALRELLVDLGWSNPRIGAHSASARHTITKYRLDCRLFEAEVDVLEGCTRETCSLTADEVLEGLAPLSTITRKLLQAGRAKP